MRGIPFDSGRENVEEYFVVKAIETSGVASLSRLLSIEPIDPIPDWISIVGRTRSYVPSILFQRPSSVSDH